MIAIIKQHKKALKEYKAKVKAYNHLRFPALRTYEDYEMALQEKQSIPYRLGSILRNFLKKCYKLEILELVGEIKAVYRQIKNKNL